MNDTSEVAVSAGTVVDFDGEELAKRFAAFMREQGRLPASERCNLQMACAALANIAGEYVIETLGGHVSLITEH